MLLQTLHQKLGWPSRDEVIAPTGAGPAVYARLVQSKLGRALSRSSGSPEVEVGILAGDPKADSTEPPLAVVCEFKRVASDAAIEEAHRLAWNFCRAPLLITLEPHLVRTWTTCERPRSKPDGTLPGAEISALRIDPRDPIDFEQAAARSLSWISLASGQLFRDYAPRFPRQQCADETLLANLKSVRSELVAQKLSIETVHDLLARLMFVQFLFHRKDDKGHSALTPEWLKKQYETKKLSSVHKDLESLLRNHSDAYAFFRLLNERFNGDLFPGKASDPRKREAEWRDEMKEVHPAHLKLLADFVGGKVLPSGQHSLWPLYSFDLIPLEFISSIYETFVSKDKGTHYTPA
ncbi:MAG: Restriction endonuclease subunit, partial [Phycisphaerales bacterium]|nr:Restriction endonuclease subunit [Phycisphaerales bacterium]